MNAYIMNNNQKHGILSLLGGLGLIILFAGIFLQAIPFEYALVIAISIWMLTGVIAKFMGVTRQGQVTNTNWRHALVSLLAVSGVIIMLSGIFLNVPFNFALLVAIAFWVLSGAVASFLGVENKNKHRHNRYVVNQPYASKTLPDNETNEYASNKYNKYGQPAVKATTSSQYTNLNYCASCGSSMQKEDTFCANCGSSNTRI